MHFVTLQVPKLLNLNTLHLKQLINKTAIPFLVVLVTFAWRVQAQSVADYDGNLYDTIVIGNQVWLKQNLKTTHDNNGTLISEVTSNSSWAALTTSGRCYYNNDSASYASVYGVLYNWMRQATPIFVRQVGMWLQMLNGLLPKIFWAEPLWQGAR
jgi:hypothetical protein